MVYPRQKLYDVNHLGYIKKYLGFKNLNNCDLSFEDAFYDLTKIKNTIPLSKGRAGLYLAIKKLLFGKKNKILLSPFTIFDVVNMVVSAGGVPVFCDSESPYSPHVSFEYIKKNVDAETSAILITHYHTVNPYIKEIAAWCRENDIFLIEDCAISLGSFINGKHVGSFGDAGFFSFGLFKFVSAYFGGAIHFNDTSMYEQIREELSNWDEMSINDLAPYFFKGVKFSILTNKYVFKYFTFPIFKFGFLNNVGFIMNQAKNDPDPVLKKTFPDEAKKRPSPFQINEFIRQFNSVDKDRQVRLKNALTHYNNLKPNNGIVIQKPNEADSFLNYPIVIKKDSSIKRDELVKKIMENNFDVAVYYYRDCSKLKCFSRYYRRLPNIEYYVNNLVVLPVYPSISVEYIDLMDNAINDIIPKDKC